MATENFHQRRLNNLLFINRRYKTLKLIRDNIAEAIPDIRIYNMSCVFHCISTGRRKDNFYFEIGYASRDVQFTVAFKTDCWDTVMIVPFVWLNQKKNLVTNSKGEIFKLFAKPNEMDLIRRFVDPSFWMRRPKLLNNEDSDFVSSRWATMVRAMQIISSLIPTAIVYNPSFYQYINPVGEKEDNFHFEVAAPARVVQATVSFQSRSTKFLKIAPFVSILGEKLQLLTDGAGNSLKHFVSVDDVDLFVKILAGFLFRTTAF
jgi:hypothetical protein